MLVFPENNPKKFYSGIGSRATPPTTQRIMMYLARELERDGYTLRSGNASGSDDAFARGVVKNAQIWLPWKDFNLEYQEERPSHTYKIIDRDDSDAYESVMRFHPNPSALSGKAMLLMMRNFRQIVGDDEPNSQFVVCWTPNGEIKGGTGQALRLARHYDTSVYNLFNMTKEDVLKEIHKLNLLQ